MTASVHSKPVRLAAVAYHAALAGQWKKASRAVQRLSDECGGHGLTLALIGWCDSYVDHATDGQETTGRKKMSFIEASTGQMDNEQSTRVPERIRWAGQLIAARAARAALDEPEWNGLIAALPEDPAEIGRHISAVLELVATTVNGLPRGFMRMGRAVGRG